VRVCWNGSNCLASPLGSTQRGSERTLEGCRQPAFDDVQGLGSTNTSAQNWGVLVCSSAAVQSGPNVTITDTVHNILTLNNVTTPVLSNYAGNVSRFV
jgi:hypothetical protein